MSKVMLVNVTHVEESRVAILEDGVLAQYEIETINRTNIKGNIHNAVVDNVHPSLEAAFLRLSGDLKGFLPLDEVNFNLLPARSDSRSKGKIGQHLHPGQKLMVQVIREPFAGKPPTVTTYFSLPGRFLVLMPGVDSAGVSRKIEDASQRERLRKLVDELNPPKGFGLIVRTAGLGQTKVELQRDLRYLLRLWESIQRASRAADFPGLVYRERDLVIRTIRDYFMPDIAEVWIDSPETHERALEFVRDVMPNKAKSVHLHTGERPLFSKFNLEEQIESIYKRRVPLRSGGEIVIDGTEALTAIDVNSARSSRHGDAEENALSTNLEAAAEIARQLRLRDLGGLVVVDFIDMQASRNQKKVEKAMRDAMKGDRAKYDVTRISKLGLLEIARQRMRSEKLGASYATCPSCEGFGLVKNVEAAGLAALRKLQARCLRGDFGRMRAALPPEVAAWVLNHKREDLLQLERRYNIRIAVEGKGSLRRHESEFETFAREKAEEPPALVVGDRPAPPLPPDLKDLVEAQEAPAGSEPALPSPGESGDASESAGAPGTGRKRRRRRRRHSRGPSGTDGGEAPAGVRERPGDVDGAHEVVFPGGPEAPEAVEADRRPAPDAPPRDSGSPSGEGIRAEGEGTPAPAGHGGATPPDGGEGGNRRRRRRRRRRGRGGAGANGAAPEAQTDGGGAPRTEGPRSGETDEDPAVPRHIRSEELMPAATGGVSRGRRARAEGTPLHGRRRRRGPAVPANTGGPDRVDSGRPPYPRPGGPALSGGGEESGD